MQLQGMRGAARCECALAQQGRRRRVREGTGRSDLLERCCCCCVWVPRCAQQHSSAHRSAAKAEAARLGLFGRGGLPLTGLGLRSQLLELLVFVVVISQPGLESLGRN